MSEEREREQMQLIADAIANLDPFSNADLEYYFTCHGCSWCKGNIFKWECTNNEAIEFYEGLEEKGMDFILIACPFRH